MPPVTPGEEKAGKTKKSASANTTPTSSQNSSLSSILKGIDSTSKKKHKSEMKKIKVHLLKEIIYM